MLGATTLAQLHKHVGDTLQLNNGSDPPSQLRIVGTATMPTLGSIDVEHLTMGTGALLSYQLIPAGVRNTDTDPIPGPNAIFVTCETARTPPWRVDPYSTFADTLPFAQNTGASAVLLAVQRPAEIVNSRSMGATPALLGAALAVGAASSLGLTLIASVRRRRHDLGLFKTLGFTRRQLTAVVARESTVAVVIGIIVGVPLGIALGRQLWILFADAIHVVAEPTIPVSSLMLVARHPHPNGAPSRGLQILEMSIARRTSKA